PPPRAVPPAPARPPSCPFRIPPVRRPIVPQPATPAPRPRRACCGRACATVSLPMARTWRAPTSGWDWLASVPDRYDQGQVRNRRSPMWQAALVLVVLVALLHRWFLVLEMLLWTRPLGRRVFRMSLEQARATRVLAANQGLYNGFLAAGLLWGAWLGAGGRAV